jgi:hypothetical protein
VSLKIALLRRTQGLIEQDFSRPGIESEQFDLVRFAGSDKKSGIRRSSFAGDARDWLQARCLRKQTEFLQISIEVRETQIDPHEKNEGFGFHRRIIRTQLAGLSSDSLVAKFTARPGTMVEIACL